MVVDEIERMTPKNILSILLILFCTMIFAEDGIRFEEKATWQQVLDKAKKENP